MGVVLTTLTEVTVTASAAELSSDHILCQSLILTADAANAGTLYISANLSKKNYNHIIFMYSYFLNTLFIKKKVLIFFSIYDFRINNSITNIKIL